MTVFGKYSSYYSLLYKDKDYAGEVEYIHNLIQKCSPDAKSVLDLGCGTGRHDLLLAKKGYDVTGVDMSEEMLAVAKANAKTKIKTSNSIAQSQSLSQSDSLISTVSFTHGDVRTIRLGKTFDVVISLFHVMSYQTTDEDLKAAFATAKAHLKLGGVFIFDCWYGPAVLTDRPTVRVKRLEDEDIFVTRIAEPVMHPNENIVDVNYHVFIRDKASDRVDEIKENHRMRYLFKPEIGRMLKLEGLELIRCEEWMSGKEPGFDTWGVSFVVRG